MHKTLALTAVMIFNAINSTSYASELELFTETFPPYNFYYQNDVVGINSDVLAKACLVAGVKCSFTLLPWQRSMKEVESEANRGIYSTSRNPQREERFVWVGPIVYSNSCFYRLKSRQEVSVRNNDDLKNYTVGISRGDIYEMVLKGMGLKEREHYLTYSQKHQDVTMFKRGKLDLMIGSSLTLTSQLAVVGLTPNDVEPVLELNDDTLGGNYLALNKNTDNAIVTKLQQALDQMKQNGEVERIVSKYVARMSKLPSGFSLELSRCVDGAANY